MIYKKENNNQNISYVNDVEQKEIEKTLEKMTEEDKKIVETRVYEMKKYPIHIILENIRSAFNVGAIFRTCDAAGIEKLWLTGITPSPPHNRIPKTALGATESVNWEYKKDIDEVLSQLRSKKIPIIAAELTENAEIYTDFKFSGPVAIIFGHEVNGVEKSTIKKCSAVVKIPMHGLKESLNVEVSCGIILFEIVRQLKTNSKSTLNQ